jgi:hypothetical protein
MSATGKKVFRMTIGGEHEGAAVWSTEPLTLRELIHLLENSTKDGKRSARIPLWLKDSKKEERGKPAHFLTIELSE